MSSTGSIGQSGLAGSPGRPGAVATGGGRVAMSARVLGVGAVAAPVLFLVGQALLPELPDDVAQAFDAIAAQRGRVLASGLLTSVGAFLFVAAVPVLAALVAPGRRGAGVLRIGLALFGIGAFFDAVGEAVQTYAIDAATHPGVSRDAGLTVVQHLGTGVAGWLIGFWSIPVLAVGLVVAAVGLLRASWRPIWLPILLIVGVVLAMAFAGQGMIVALAQLPLTVALVGLALPVLRMDGR